MKNKNTLIALLLVVIALMLVFEWRPWHQDQAPLSSAKPAPENAAADSEPTELVNLATQAPEETSKEIRAQLSAVDYTTIAAELPARVQSMPFKEGKPFKKGQVIVQFECSTQQAQYQKTQALLAIAERAYNTNKQLLELESISRIAYENSFSEYQKAKAESDELRAVLSRCSIHAPYSGLVAEQKVREQQFVQLGQPLLEILNNSALELEFVAPSKWSNWLVEGYKFKIKLDETGKEYPARITRVNGKIDPVSQTIKAAAVIDGKFNEISPGMSGVLLIDENAK